MARNKTRPQHASQGSQTAIVPESAVTGLTTRPSPKVTTVNASANGQNVKKNERFWLEVWAVRMARTLGSLPIAVFGLSIFATVLIVGTIIESAFSGKMAQELIYRTWWFMLLLAVLGVNIFFAAVKKWPWKKHQTGFLITHVGLLTLVTGGILNNMNGVDALLPMVDNDQADYQGYGRQVDHQAIDKDDAQIHVTRVQKNSKEETLVYSFRPGSLPWRTDQYLERKLRPLLAVLDWLANPFPRQWQADLGHGAELEVLAFYPHARREPYSAAEKSDSEIFPAVKVALSSSRAGTMPDRWCALNSRDQQFGMGAGAVEILGRGSSGQVEEFLHLPAVKELGEKGQLVIRVGNGIARFDVDKQVGGSFEPIAATGWKARLIGFDANPRGQARMAGVEPTVDFEIQSPAGKTWSWRCYARLPGMCLDPNQKQQMELVPELADITAWYHFADVRMGNASTRGVLQFLCGDDGQLYYRSFSSSKEVFHLENAGHVTVAETIPIWQGMDWKFKATEFLPRATYRLRYVPENRRPGQEVMGVNPAIRCRLTSGKDSTEFWVGQDDSRPKPVQVGDQLFQVGYQTHMINLGFDLKLLRAEQQVDRGTQQPATYTSYVQVTDKKNGVLARDFVITMNEPLDYNGFKFYQSGYRPVELIDPTTQRSVSQSTFTVSRDPGLPLKYAGSVMLALGISCMFYMRAYFFKPRGRKTSATPAAIGG